MGLFLLVNDIHAADRPPSSCTESYLDDLEDLLMQTSRLAWEREVNAVIWPGDVLHYKAPSRTSHRLLLRLITVIKSYPCPVYVVPGNHDIQHDRLDSLTTTQPLGVLLHAGLGVLSGWSASTWTEGYGEDRLPLYGVPWLQGYGAYTEASDAAVGRALQAYGDDDGTPGRALVVAHAPLYPPGRELPHEYFPAERWAEAMGGQGFCWYGHVHEDHGTYQAGGVTFANFGALSRGSLHEYNLTRDVCVGIWDSATGEFERVKLDAKPATEIFRLAERDETTDIQGRLDEFLQQAAGTTLRVLSAEAVLAHIGTMGLGKEAEDLAADLLEEAQHADSR